MPEWEFGEGEELLEEPSLSGAYEREAILRAEFLDQFWMVAERKQQGSCDRVHYITHYLA
jgi:hypothetical protein